MRSPAWPSGSARFVPIADMQDAVAELDRTDAARREQVLEGSLRRHATSLTISPHRVRGAVFAAASVSCETVRVGIALIESYRFSSDPKELGIGGLAARARRIEELGFDGILSSETAGHDPFFPLLIAAEHTTRVRLSTGVAIAFPRAPMVVAQMAWDLQRLSAGRFTLGLGTQVKGHNERRYGVPWTGAPGPRMREYVACLRAIFQSFQHPEAPRWFEGAHYRFSMLPPVFAPEPIEHPQIPIHIAAVNPYMSRLAGESLRRGLRASRLYAEVRARGDAADRRRGGARGRAPLRPTSRSSTRRSSSRAETTRSSRRRSGSTGAASPSTPRPARTTPSSSCTAGRSSACASTRSRSRVAGTT